MISIGIFNSQEDDPLSHGIDQLSLSSLLIIVEFKSYNVCPHTTHVPNTHECLITEEHSVKMELVTWSILLAVYKTNKTLMSSNPGTPVLSHC